MLRLDKYLANNARLSRSEARAAIRDGIVTVNGVAVTAIGDKVKESDSIFILNQEVKIAGGIYLAFHKPAGVICATEDAEHDTVLDLIPDYDDEDLKIAGRLDLDTTGIVLLSTDGQWIHRVTSPNYKQVKVYEVKTDDPIDQELVGKFAQGILLKDSDKLTLPAKLIIDGEKSASLELREGRYHQVKRMFGASGNKVTQLHRRSVGLVHLDVLQEGEYRELSAEEIESFGKKA